MVAIYSELRLLSCVVHCCSANFFFIYPSLFLDGFVIGIFTGYCLLYSMSNVRYLIIGYFQFIFIFEIQETFGRRRGCRKFVVVRAELLSYLCMLLSMLNAYDTKCSYASQSVCSSTIALID